MRLLGEIGTLFIQQAIGATMATEEVGDERGRLPPRWKAFLISLAM